MVGYIVENNSGFFYLAKGDEVWVGYRSKCNII